MDEQRDEVYERIPWETLEEKGKDRQWLVLGVAGAVVAGVLAYSFVSNRPMPLAEVTPTSVPTVPATAIPAAPPVAAGESVPTTPANVAEADLYAVDPGVLADGASAHARLVVREFLSTSGSEVLRTLLPSDVPLPTAPDGVLVFVEWVETVSVVEVDIATFRVTVLARYMISTEGEPYVQAPPELLTLDVAMSGESPVVTSAPTIEPFAIDPAGPLALGVVPPEVVALIGSDHPGAEIVGGRALVDGSWTVVLMVPGPGGVSRPESVSVGGAP